MAVVVENREPLVARSRRQCCHRFRGVIVTELFAWTGSKRGNGTTRSSRLTRAIDPNGVLADRAAFGGLVAILVISPVARVQMADAAKGAFGEPHGTVGCRKSTEWMPAVLSTAAGIALAPRSGIESHDFVAAPVMRNPEHPIFIFDRRSMAQDLSCPARIIFKRKRCSSPFR